MPFHELQGKRVINALSVQSFGLAVPCKRLIVFCKRVPAEGSSDLLLNMQKHELLAASMLGKAGQADFVRYSE
jgi:hypothetical protein